MGKKLEKSFFIVSNICAFFRNFLKKILLPDFFVIGFKPGNSLCMGEYVEDVKLVFWVVGKG
jgi:hypothetical protein